jgi:hypothetical protein
VDREVARSADGAGEVDRLRGPHPGSADRDAQDVDGLLRHGQRVTRVEDGGVPEGEEVPGVEETRQVGMDHGVELADGHGRDAGVELLAGAHHGDPLRDRGRVVADPRCDRVDGEHGGVGPGEMVGQVVIGVLVGDHHRIRAVDGLRVGEHPGVHHDDLPVVLQPDAGVPELRDPHGLSLGRSWLRR